MLKQLIRSSAFLILLCGLALAAPTPAVPQPPPSRIQIGFRVEVGKDVRHYAIELVDQRCGEVQSIVRPKGQVTEDNIKVCARPEAGKLVVEVDWETKDPSYEVRTKSVGLVARNASFDLDGGTSKLTVTVQ
jgi:hypothetical protein